MSSLPPENFINIIINTHNPAKLIATAHTMMDAPAIAWEYFSKELNLKTFKPFINKKTNNNIVTNVTTPNTSATWKTNIISADMMLVFQVALVFGVVTLVTMLLFVFLLMKGLNVFKFNSFEKYSHAIAGASIMVCAVAINFAGL